LGHLTLKLKALPLFGPSRAAGQTTQSQHLGRFHIPTTFPLDIAVCGFHVTRFLLLYMTRVFFRSAAGRTEEFVNHT